MFAEQLTLPREITDQFRMPKDPSYRPCELLPVYRATGKRAPKPRAGLYNGASFSVVNTGSEIRTDFVAKARLPWKRPKDQPMKTKPGPDTYTLEIVSD